MWAVAITPSISMHSSKSLLLILHLQIRYELQWDLSIKAWPGLISGVDLYLKSM